MKQCYTIPYKPDSANTHWRRGRNVTYLSKTGREFRNNVQSYMKLYNYKTYEKRVKVKLDLFFADKKARDLDNYFKSVLDCFKGFLYVDDKQIDKIEATKHTGAGKNYFIIEVEELKE
nr:MAG TPA: Endodeoxyribonuclease RusA [Caudoviricetes sp.]